MSNERLNRNQRRIRDRLIVKGTLVLDSPTCLGNGDAEGPTDLMLLRDSISSRALLSGASIAGALRNHLHEYENGCGVPEEGDSLATYLFGSIRQNENGEQSPLIVCDSLSDKTPQIELRDGVKINVKTGTAADKAKYDLELLAAGTKFPLCFELLVDERADKQKLLQALAIALQGLETSQISIGMKKRRGFGRCRVEQWQVWQFDLSDYSDRLAWLTLEREGVSQHAKPPAEGKIIDILKPETLCPDKRERFLMKATFKLAGSLLIRSGQNSTEAAPDVVHLKSKRNGEDKPVFVLSGTSLAGVLRHRADRIVKTLGKSEEAIAHLFGEVEEASKKANSSRLIVSESIIDNCTELVQNRIAIDRFTGGAYHGALFEEQPIFSNDSATVTLELELRQPDDAEIGLLLLLLKDLWTRDLPVGGESSIGRGRLQGICAEMSRYAPDKETQIWTIEQEGDKLRVSDAEALESFVSKFVG